MPAFDPKNAAIVAPGGVSATVRLTQPGAGGISAVLVLERALQDEHFLAARMRIVGDSGAGLELRHAHGFAAKFVQGHRTEAGNAARLPRCGIGIDGELAVVAGGELA